MAVFTYSPYEVALLSGVGAFGAIVPAVAVWLPWLLSAAGMLLEERVGVGVRGRALGTHRDRYCAVDSDGVKHGTGSGALDREHLATRWNFVKNGPEMRKARLVVKRRGVGAGRRQTW